MNARVGTTTLALSALLLVACSSEEPNADDTATETYELIAAHPLTVDTPAHEAFEEFASLIDERTDGQIAVTIHPAGQLGGIPENFQGLEDGSIDLTVVSPGAVAEFIPEIDILSLPFLVGSREHRDAVIDSDGIAAIEEKLATEHSAVTLGYFGGGVRNMFFTDPVEDAADIQGRLLRVIPTPVLAESFEAMGLKPTTLTVAELYSGLLQGVVDGAENESVYILSERFYEPAPHIVRTEHEVTIRPFLVSQRTLDRLPSDLADLVLEIGAEVAAHEREREAADDDEAIEVLVNEHEVDITEIDVEPLRDAVEPVWAKYAAQWGNEDFLEEIKALR